MATTPDPERELARLAAIVESSQDAILAKDLTGTITAWNPAAERLYGYTSAEAVGQSIDLLIPDDHRGESEQFLAEVLAGRAVPAHDTVRVTKSGERRTMSVAVSPIRDASGAVVGASTIARDVTAAREAEAAIEESRAREEALTRELEQTRRLESVGQLAGGVAHDFNNLLGVILNLAQFATEELPAGTQARADLDEIVAAARRGAALTRQLLVFSRRDTVQVAVFDIGEVVASLGTFLRRALGEANSLEIERGDPLWPVEMDRGQFEQIVVNLAINARDAMPGGGRLIIETRNTVVDEAFSRTRVGLPPGDYVTLTVSDTGEGMDEEVLTRAFEPFYTTKPQGQGTGLGLATVYGIVTEAGGRIALYSERGQGTSVKVHLPAKRDAVPTTTVPERGGALAGRGERILVVEDAEDVRQITVRILKRGGYETATASGVREARELLDGGLEVDLVLTDVVMPDGTGPDLVDDLARTRPGLPALFMSGYSHRLITPSAPDAPAFIEKPFSAAQLLAKVRELLGDDAASG